MGFEQLIILAIIATVAPIVTAIGVYILGSKMGFGPLQDAVREERGALVKTLRERMDLIEKDNARLEKLYNEEKRKNKRLEDRVSVLESRLLELALDRRDE